VLEVQRELEFAPIKNADAKEGIAVDSPASARALLLAESDYWLIKSGHTCTNGRIFISPLLSYEGEGLYEVLVNLDANGKITEITP
jgi:hypothetical protein